MAVTIKDLKDNEEFTGKTVDSVVRRVWGRQCFAKRDVEVRGRAQVLKPAQGDGSYHVLASIFIYED